MDSQNKTNNQTKNENSQQKQSENQTKPRVKHWYRHDLDKKQLWIWAICTIGIALLTGGLASLLGGNMDHFEAHTLPPLTPPTIVFPIVWGILYILIGVSAFIVFVSKTQTKQTLKWDMIWFGINLALNAIWPLLFYRLDLLIISTILCGLVFISAIITCFRFYYRNTVGGLLYTPYILWLLFAFYLNLGITLLNV